VVLPEDVTEYLTAATMGLLPWGDLDSRGAPAVAAAKEFKKCG